MTHETNERGFAVPLALLVIVALGLVGAAAAYMSAGDTNVAGLYSTSNRTADAAGAGIEHGVALYDARLDTYTSGDVATHLLGAGWPLTGQIDGYDYSVVATRDSFDFDGDGDQEPVSCKTVETGGGDGGGDGGDGGNGDGGEIGAGDEQIGDTPGGDSGDYWEDSSGGDQNGDGQQGLSGGHFDVDVFTAGNKREYHQHEFDDKYDTTKTENVSDPNLLWDEIFKDYSGGPVTVTFKNTTAAPGWHRITLVNGTVFENLNKDATSYTFNPKQVTAFRTQYTNLTGFSCTNPGAVKTDAEGRAGAFTFLIKDGSGNLLYEFSVYWHNNSDDCVPEDDNDTTKPDKGSGKTGDDVQPDQNKANKLCGEYAQKIAEAEEYMEKAQAKYAEADAKEAQGKSKDAAKKRAEGDELVAKANQKYVEAGVKCDSAKNYGTCTCSTTPGWETEDEDDPTADQGDTHLDCELNGDGEGQPVFLLTSTATRSVYTAVQRMRVTMDETFSKVWRFSWLAD